MNLTKSNYKKIQKIFSKVYSTVYPEPESQLHTGITSRMIKKFLKLTNTIENMCILDIGCGQGVALEEFKKYNLQAIGITLDDTDINVCKNKNLNVLKMDQHFLDFKKYSFDRIWYRHCLEHSICPMLALTECYRVLKYDSFAYIEIPAPDTDCNHQTNKNHYSVLTKSMWIELFTRTGFSIAYIEDIPLSNGSDIKDEYWAFFVHKKPKSK